MNALSMAARNAFRYGRRTLITASSIAAAVMFAIAMDGFIAGSENETIRNLRDFETGEATIYPPGYFANRDELPFDRFIERADRDAIESILSGSPATPRVRLSCELYLSEESFAVPGSITAELFAVDPERDRGVFKTAGAVSAGRWLKPGDRGIVLGSWLAEDARAKVGYTLTVECRGRGGFYQTFDAPIIGIAKTGDPTVNRDAAFIDLAYADELLALSGGVTEYAIRLGGAESVTGSWGPDRKLVSETAKIRERLAAAGVNADAYDWREIGSDTLKLLRAQTGETTLYLFFIFAIAAVGITNTMLMAVLERTREIGTLRALGFENSRIRRLFLAEGFVIALIGSVAGLALGTAATWYLTVRGMDFGFMLRETNIGYRITGVIRSAWDIPGIARTIAFTLAISTLVAWFPSGAVLRREVADILRGGR
jgi:ABC-type lipoprotein release transport system permease subunit